jgi:hypothetical protein
MVIGADKLEVASSGLDPMGACIAATAVVAHIFPTEGIDKYEQDVRRRRVKRRGEEGDDDQAKHGWALSWS